MNPYILFFPPCQYCWSSYIVNDNLVILEYRTRAISFASSKGVFQPIKVNTDNSMGLAATARIRGFNALGNTVHAGAHPAQGECERSHELPFGGLRPAIEAGPLKRRVPNALSKLTLLQRGTCPFVAQKITRFPLAPVSALASQHPDQGSSPEHVPSPSSSQKGAACERDSHPTERLSEEDIKDEAQGNLAEGGYEDPTLDLTRSQLVRGLLLGLGACGAGCLTEGDQNAQATGLILFPPAKLTNEYFLVRAGMLDNSGQVKRSRRIQAKSELNGKVALASGV